MSYLAEIDMTVADFREHYAPVEAAAKEPHWLLGSLYGRDLLKIKLRISRPEVVVPEWKHAAHLDPLLEDMVDELGLREMPEPKTFVQRLAYVKTVATMALAVKKNMALPEWRLNN
ncbi:hypothetical protein [Limnohabitans sp.]|uniref:hypothetical protein n=1 Tax=Limnohabitans sp. TaxID=1907725 RepID=UPI0026052B70|nr:hypothetical protein [Limnohabitans sp.]